MKPVFEKVPHRDWESFHCETVHGPDYGTRWHFHPEYQLTLAIRSLLKSKLFAAASRGICPVAEGHPSSRWL